MPKPSDPAAVLLAAAERYRTAELQRRAALAEQRERWESDRPGRRLRGARVSTATRSAQRAMAELIGAVQATPPELTGLVTCNGATYADSLIGWGAEQVGDGLRELRRVADAAGVALPDPLAGPLVAARYLGAVS